MRNLAVAALLFVCAPTAVECQKLVLGRSQGVHGIVQWWETVADGWPHQQTLRGTIVGLKQLRHNPDLHGCLSQTYPYAICADDGDWNIHVEVDPQFQWLLFNSRQQKNDGGAIELEVRNTVNLHKYFKVGDVIEAAGWFVEDFGHTSSHPRTELHPVLYLRKVVGSKTTLVLTPDLSARFAVASDPFIQWFSGVSLPLANTPTKRELTTWTGPASAPLDVLNELSTADVTSAWMSNVDDASATAAYEPFSSKVRADYGIGGLRMIPDLGSGGPYVDPFYAGEFTRASTGTFSETLSTLLTTNQNGIQVLSSDVNISLTDPPATPLSFFSWEYDESPATGGIVRRRVEPGTTRAISMKLVYSPAEGWRATRWPLWVFGTSRASDWYPGRRTTAIMGELAPEARTFAAARRLYTLNPSSTALVQEPQYQRWQGSPSGPQCAQTILVRRSLSLVHPQANVRDSAWTMALIVDQLGQRIANPSTVDVPKTGEFDYGFVKVRRVDRHVAEVQFTNVLTQPTFLSGGSLVFDNPAKVHFAASLVTALGERSAGVVDVKGLRCVSFPPQTNDLLSRFDMFLFAVRRLQELGKPGFPLPAPLPQNLIREMREMPRGLGYVEEWYEDLPRSARPIADAFLASMRGERQDARRFNALLDTLRPLARITRLPPKSPSPLRESKTSTPASVILPNR